MTRPSPHPPLNLCPRNLTAEAPGRGSGTGKRGLVGGAECKVPALLLLSSAASAALPHQPFRDDCAFTLLLELIWREARSIPRMWPTIPNQQIHYIPGTSCSLIEHTIGYSICITSTFTKWRCSIWCAHGRPCRSTQRLSMLMKKRTWARGRADYSRIAAICPLSTAPSSQLTQYGPFSLNVGQVCVCLFVTLYC